MGATAAYIQRKGGQRTHYTVQFMSDKGERGQNNVKDIPNVVADVKTGSISTSVLGCLAKIHFYFLQKSVCNESGIN